MEKAIDNIAYYDKGKKVILVEDDLDRSQGLISLIRPFEDRGKKGLSQRRTPKDNVTFNGKDLILKDDGALVLWLINSRAPEYPTLLNKYNQAT